MPQRVLFISTMESVPWGGSEVLWFQSALYLKKSGYDVTVCVLQWNPTPAPIEVLEQNGVHIVCRPNNREVKGRFLQTLTKIQKLYSPFQDAFVKRLLGIKADIILISQGGTFDFLYLPWLESFLSKTDVPAFCLCHSNKEFSGILNPSQRSRFTLFQQRLSKIFFIANRHRLVAERQSLQPISNYTIIKNPVPSHTSFSEFPSIVNTINIACVGLIDCSVKGQDLLLNAIFEMPELHHLIKINFYGQGRDVDYIKELIKFYKLESLANMHGQVTDLKQIWENNHVLFSPSHNEGIPLSMIEAMFFGRVVCASNVGDISNYIDENIGFLMAGPSVSECKLALGWLVTNKGTLAQKGKAAHESVLEKFNGHEVQSFLQSCVGTYV